MPGLPMGELMTRFEYKVVPAPRRGEKARGVKGLEDRFALALTTLMNRLGRDGWEYLRTDTLPVEERHGLAGRITTSYQNMLVFRRALAAAATEPAAADARPPADAAAPPQPSVEPPPEPDPLSTAAATQLASVHPLPEPQQRGPRLVGTPSEDGGFLNAGKAPPVGPATEGAASKDPGGSSAQPRPLPRLTRKGKDEPPAAG
jgi:hypothetical protein